jgi:hypothetical protein
VALNIVCAMLLPFPSEKPDAVPVVSAAVHANVVPAVALVNVMPVVPPEQMVCRAGVAIAVGAGFTVITTVIAVPEHPFAEGVMV